MAIGVHVAEDHTIFRQGVESIVAARKGWSDVVPFA
jgi:hypothetical protein